MYTTLYLYVLSHDFTTLKWYALLIAISVMPRSHIHGSPRRFYYGLNHTHDPENANFRRSIRMHYMRMIKYYYVWLRMRYGELRTNTDCHEWCWIVSVANPLSSPWMCDLGISGDGDEMRVSFNRLFPFETVTKISLSMAAVLQSGQ